MHPFREGVNMLLMEDRRYAGCGVKTCCLVHNNSKSHSTSMRDSSTIERLPPDRFAWWEAVLYPTVRLEVERRDFSCFGPALYVK